MRRPVKLVLLILAMGASAGIGALIAANSEVLAPQVGDGGSPTASRPTTVVRWRGTLRSATIHQLYVGGVCGSNWLTTISVSVDDRSRVTGAGRARSTHSGCDFATGQIPIETIVLRVSGRVAEDGFVLHLAEISHVPSTGASDLGGFVMTVLPEGRPSTLRIPLKGVAVAAGSVTLRKIGDDRDVFTSVNRIRLRCLNCPNS